MKKLDNFLEKLDEFIEENIYGVMELMLWVSLLLIILMVYL